MTAKDRSLDKACAGLLLKICQKYDNLAEVDKLAAVSKKVDSVKLIMQENVDLALQNCVKLETIEKAAGKVHLCFISKRFLLLYNFCVEELQQQAGVFKRNANELKNKMWWKNMKVKYLIYIERVLL